MARFLSGKHLTSEQLASLRSCQLGTSACVSTTRQLLRQVLGLPEVPPGAAEADPAAAEQARLQQEIVTDLFAYTLRQGQAWGFDDERLSVLVGLVKEVHEASVAQRLTIEASFGLFKDSLLNHSVHRPPFSCGVFSQAEMRAVLDWMLSSYYRHYKLYQYAFTSRVTLSLTTFHPRSLVEVPPPALPPLAEALTEAQHTQQLNEQQRRAEEEQRQVAAAAALAAEEAAAGEVAEAYEASLPDDVKTKVADALEREVAYLRRKLEEEFQVQQAGLVAKLAQLEAAAAERAVGQAPPVSSRGAPAPAAARPVSGASAAAS